MTWAFLRDPERRAEWWPELQLDLKQGGTVAEQWAEGEGDERVSRDASGEVDVLVAGHALGFRWKEGDDQRSTAVLITLRSLDAGSSITVTETGFDALPDASARAAASQEGWDVLLRDLLAALERAEELPDGGEPQESSAGLDAAAGAAAAGGAAAADDGAESADAAAVADEDAAGNGAATADDDDAAAVDDAAADDDAEADDATADDVAEADEAELGPDDEASDEDADVVDAEIVEEHAPDGGEDDRPTDDAGASTDLAVPEQRRDDAHDQQQGHVDAEAAAWASAGVSITVDGALPQGDGQREDSDDSDDPDDDPDFDSLIRGL